MDHASHFRTSNSRIYCVVLLAETVVLGVSVRVGVYMYVLLGVYTQESPLPN